MTAMILLAALPYPAPDVSDPAYPGVTLADARAFGVSKEAVRPLWLLAGSGRRRMREAVGGGWNNPPDVAERWEAESGWRERCWFLLDDAVFCNLTPRQKLRSLDELRTLIGDEDYYAGRMPAPLCSYRIAH